MTDLLSLFNCPQSVPNSELLVLSYEINRTNSCPEGEFCPASLSQNLKVYSHSTFTGFLKIVPKAKKISSSIFYMFQGPQA